MSTNLLETKDFIHATLVNPSLILPFNLSLFANAEFLNFKPTLSKCVWLRN